MNQEPYQLSPNDWFDVRVKYGCGARGFLIATLTSSDDDVFIHVRKIEISPGMHNCVLPPGTEGVVRIEPNSGGRSPYKALAARFEQDAPNRTEVSRVHVWHTSHGSFQRDCGCFIFARDGREPNLVPGDFVEHDVVRNARKGWAAENLKIYTAQIAEENQQ